MDFPFDEIRDGAAMMVLETLRGDPSCSAHTVGEQFILDNMDQRPVTLWAYVLESGHVTQMRHGGDTDVYTLVMQVPRQVGEDCNGCPVQFPPSEIRVGAQVIYPKRADRDGHQPRQFQVDERIPDNGSLANSATIEFHCGAYGDTVEMTNPGPDGRIPG